MNRLWKFFSFEYTSKNGHTSVYVGWGCLIPFLVIIALTLGIIKWPL